MQSCSNPGENGRKNDFCQNMGLTDAKIAGDFQIDGIYISDGRDRSQKNRKESGDKNDNKSGHFANAEKQNDEWQPGHGRDRAEHLCDWIQKSPDSLVPAEDQAQHHSQKDRSKIPNQKTS